jgi:hypothetical protein
MNSETVSEWLASLSVSEKIRALTRIYSWFTVCTRQLFIPDPPTGKEEIVISMLHGVNEIHHTLASWLLAYVTDESKAFPVDALSRQLLEIANQYRIESLLTSAVEFARTRNPRPGT